MKKTFLFDKHVELNAKMVNYAGFNMPIQYDGVKIEHNTVRNSVGLFDVSHMGEIFISGTNALSLLQFITSNDVSLLIPGKVQYTCLLNKNGGIVDDCLLYMFNKEKYMLVVNAANIKKDLDWILKCNEFGCDIKDQSDNYSLLAVQGPKSNELLSSIININFNEIKYYNFKVEVINSIGEIIISRTGYTGEIGFELYIKNENASKLWDLLFSTDIELKPIGLAARNTLRLEKGFCLYGNDIDESVTPIEAGLGWITKTNKQTICGNILSDQKKLGVEKKLVGIEIIEKGIARTGYSIFHNDELVGEITSGSISPSSNKSIAMGYVKTKYSDFNTILSVSIRNKMIKSKIVKIPFY